MDEFLVMHQFGPYVIYDAGHMERLLRRVIALMLQLRQERDITGAGGYNPPPPPVTFLKQEHPRSWPTRGVPRLQPSEDRRR